jgi:hypothetical protein
VLSVSGEPTLTLVTDANKIGAETRDSQGQGCICSDIGFLF